MWAYIKGKLENHIYIITGGTEPWTEPHDARPLPSILKEIKDPPKLTPQLSVNEI